MVIYNDHWVRKIKSQQCNIGLAAHKCTGLVTTLLQSSNSLLEITCRRPLDGYSYTLTHNPGRRSPVPPPAQPFPAFFSSGVWNIWNLEMLTIFLSHIKILTHEIYLTLSTVDGTDYKWRTLDGLYPSVISQYSLFFFSVYIIAILDFTSLNVNSKKMLFLLPRHFLSPGPQPSDVP